MNILSKNKKTEYRLTQFLFIVTYIPILNTFKENEFQFHLLLSFFIHPINLFHKALKSASLSYTFCV